MKICLMLAAVLVAAGAMHTAHAEPTVEIVMDKTTYSYCEKLFYSIRVPEVADKIAIIHIRDSVGKSSSAVPIAITGLETAVPSQAAFEKSVFQQGDYFIDVEYSGSSATAKFTLIDSGLVCLPEVVKPYVANWIGGLVPDGVVMDAFAKYVDAGIMEIPFQITGEDMKSITIPEWVKGLALWWMGGQVSDMEFINALEHLMEQGIISPGPRYGT